MKPHAVEPVISLFPKNPGQLKHDCLLFALSFKVNRETRAWSWNSGIKVSSMSFPQLESQSRLMRLPLPLSLSAQTLQRSVSHPILPLALLIRSCVQHVQSTIASAVRVYLSSNKAELKTKQCILEGFVGAHWTCFHTSSSRTSLSLSVKTFYGTPNVQHISASVAVYITLTPILWVFRLKNTPKTKPAGLKAWPVLLSVLGLWLYSKSYAPLK